MAVGHTTSKPFKGSFKGKNVISVEQFTSRKEIEFLFALADEMKISVEKRSGRKEMKDFTFVELFYQPSTRTFTSFQAAAKWLGCQRVIAIPGMAAYSSAVKGESLRDTIRTIEATTAADMIVLRHPDDNSCVEAACFAKVPIINAGSGRIAHPTQAILDLYTIRQELGRLDDLTVTMIGDLRNGRTIKSLSKLLVLSGKGIKLNFVAPEVLKMPPKIVAYLSKRGAKVFEGGNGALKEVLRSSDVLYVTRVQKEWFVRQALDDIKKTFGPEAEGFSETSLLALAEEKGKNAYQKAVEGYVLDNKTLRKASSKMIVMHPLPRVGEIAYEVDDDPRAVYFPQMRNGLYTRMALLKAVLEK